jgi:hypothetical protein
MARLLFQPFYYWFEQAYTSVQKWTGLRTSLTTYLTQWGVLLFFIISWMSWETRQWLAETPFSALRKLRPYRDVLLAGAVIFGLILVAQQIWVMLPEQTPAWKGITILWLAFPLASCAILLVFRPALEMRLVLFMIELEYSYDSA